MKHSFAVLVCLWVAVAPLALGSLAAPKASSALVFASVEVAAVNWPLPADALKDPMSSVAVTKPTTPPKVLADNGLQRLQLRHDISLQRQFRGRLGELGYANALAAYARDVWHLGPRLPLHDQCLLALKRSAKSKKSQLIYVELEHKGRRQRVYPYLDQHGSRLLVGSRGESYQLVDPVMPVRRARISSGWGWRTQPVLGGPEFHHGIDYAAPLGTPVRATMNGLVRLSGWRGNYGRLVEIQHDRQLSTRYGHLRAYAAGIRVGARVRRGQIIGYVGSSGLSTGPHLYYEVWNHGRRINPLAQRRLISTAGLDARERRQLDHYVNSVRLR